MATRAIIVAGAGGVGKTTIAASIAVTAARSGIRTLVVTVDPAQRLADALGHSLSSTPRPVPGVDGLDAAMTDITESWEAIARRHATTEVADRLLSNPFFRAIADRFPAAQSYASGEQLADYLEAHVWDLVVVDTPPSSGGLDFFAAPRNIQELIGGRLLRWITGASIPGRRMLYRVTARPMLKFADQVLGGPLLEEIAEFFLDLRSLYDGLKQRARAIERYFRESAVVLVSTADQTPMREARRFFDELSGSEVHPQIVLFNRTLPSEWIDAPIKRAPAGINMDVRIELKENLARWSEEARRQQDARAEFAARHDVPTVTIPWLAKAPTSPDALFDLLSFDPQLTKDLYGSGR